MNPLRSLLVGLVIGLLCVMPWACAKRSKVGPDGNSNRPVTSAPSAVVDESLLAYLSSARSLHHEADLYEDKNDPRGAIGALERLLAIPSKPSPEVDEVVADTRARLAELRSELGDFDAALQDVALGLKAAPAVSYFRGHLLEVKGLVLQKRAQALADKGDAEGAKKAKDEAMTAFEEAVAVQGEVIKKGSAPAGGPP